MKSTNIAWNTRTSPDCSRTGRPPITALLRIAMFIAALAPAGFLAPPAHAQPWPIKSFQVVAVEPSGAGGNPGQNLARLLRNDLVDIDASHWRYFQTVPQTPARDRMMRDLEAAFAQAAAIYEQNGFPPPDLEPIVRRDDGSQAYRVYLVSGLSTQAGFYHGQGCAQVGSRGERVILVDYDDAQKDDQLTVVGIQIAAHELFHAVQHATSFFRNCSGDPIGSWITEGSAKGVGWMVATKIRPQQVMAKLTAEKVAPRNQAEIWSLRDYAQRLPVPYHLGGGDPPWIAYGTGSFWMYLGEYEAQRGRPLTPGMNPYSIAYLARLFAAPPSAHDCIGAGADCRDEIAWLDRELNSVFGKPLRDLYARFIQAYALYGGSRLRSIARWSPLWLEGAFKHRQGPPCTPVEFRHNPNGRDKLQATAKIVNLLPWSALCWEIKLDGFTEPELPVVITAEIRSGAQQPSLNQLTSAMADGSRRMKRAKSEDYAGYQKVTWEYKVPVLKPTDYGEGKLLVITNVADRAAATRGFSASDGTTIDLTFTAIKEFAALGAKNADTSAIADAIETALPIKFDVYMATVMTGQHGEGEKQKGKRKKNFPGTGYSEGVMNPCILSISAASRPKAGAPIGNSMSIGLQTSGPLRPGVYPVVRTKGFAPGALLMEAMPQGEVAAGVNLASLPYGRNNLILESGVLKIDSVSGALVRGSLVGVGVGRELTGYPPREKITATRTIAAKFAIRAKPPVGRRYTDKPYPCLKNR